MAEKKTTKAPAKATVKKTVAKPTNSKQGANNGSENQPLPDNPVMIITQYLKDLSFENPNVPEILSRKEMPEINITVNISINSEAENIKTVDLTLKAESKLKDGVQFITEITYGALVKLHESLEAKYYDPLLKVEIPRMLFPFVRNILVDASRDGGFPPLFLQPIDFADIYRRQLEDKIDDAAQDIPKH